MISIIVTSIGFFDEHIVPLVTSFREYNKDVEILVVDPGDTMPEKMEGARIIKLEAGASRAWATNIGLNEARGDYLMILDNDVRCHGVYNKIERLDKNMVHGTDLRNMDNRDDLVNVPWFDEWCIIIPRPVYNKLGGFDTNLLSSMSFGGYDYCMRAKEAGIELNQVYLSFEHLWAETKRDITKDYGESEQKNKEYIMNKWKK